MIAKNTILKFHQVQQRTNLSPTEISQKINAGTFPKPFKRNAWLKSHIDDWQHELKNIDFQKVEIILRRLIFLVQIVKFVYSCFF